MTVPIHLPARKCASCEAPFRPKRVGDESCAICRLNDKTSNPHPHSNLQCAACRTLAESIPAKDLLVATCRTGRPHDWRERKAL